ncbi:MAG: 4-hydroxy-tetrahydrodipicolinate reductase [Gammaproteobacteria bacterium]|nr:4-hydroxy-tetrahydrodipicolinate reductase [Gammaproteobacteria bacterium]NND58664.1 4-hydroxy-tetrahydrodipicolinate reductase [Gammaproteobacteria bacterium]
MLRVAIFGAGGRMGRVLCDLTDNGDDLQLVGALVRPGSKMVGEPAGRDVVYTDQPVAALDNAEVAIDFSLPEAFNSNLSSCIDAGVPVVIGTTGLSSVQHQRLRDAGHQHPVLWAPNMSVGVNLLFRLTQIAAGVLDEDYDAEIVDIHHRYKRDAPSGTALRFGEVIAGARDRKLEDIADFRGRNDDRQRHRGDIGFSAVRAGDIAGEHSVIFATAGESVELRHRAASREAFADGALRAAGWLAGRPAGLYGMADVLDLK